MDILIKKIRSFLDMSQVDLAEKLNVTFATVNRWENGRSVPNKLAQSKLLEICKDNAVPVYNIILEKIAECSSKLNLEDKRVILYHGSKSGINGEIAPKSRKQCDFGKGFYMGTEPSQALSANIDWAMLVAYNRGRMDAVKGTDFYNKYRDMSSNKDLIIGNIANDRMFFVIDNFFIGNITDVALVNSLSALQLGKQYVAVSQKACDAVSIEKELTLSYLERQVIKEVAEDNRAKGVSFANEICKKARREGLFFDEILDNAKEVDEG
jgi:transcriptional regulator with XRE-family HTH domain